MKNQGAIVESRAFVCLLLWEKGDRRRRWMRCPSRKWYLYFFRFAVAERKFVHFRGVEAPPPTVNIEDTPPRCGISFAFSCGRRGTVGDGGWGVPRANDICIFSVRRQRAINPSFRAFKHHASVANALRCKTLSAKGKFHRFYRFCKKFAIGLQKRVECGIIFFTII